MVSVEQMQRIEDINLEDQRRADINRQMETEQFKFSQMLLENDLKHVPQDVPQQFWGFWDK